MSSVADNNRMSAPAVPRKTYVFNPREPVANLPSVGVLPSTDWDDWDRFVRDSGEGSVFHTSAWLRSTERVFGHQAVVIVAKRDRRIVGGVPFCIVRSLFGGTMLVSVPYGVYGGYVGEGGATIGAVDQEVRRIAAEHDARVIDLRSERARWNGVPVINRYATYRKQLPDRRDACLPSLPRKARAAARSARLKHGLVAVHDDGQLHTVWKLYCRNMHRLGSLNYPFAFFEELSAETGDDHVVTIVKHEERTIAGLVSFLFNGSIMPYFVGIDERFAHTNVYNFIYLSVMEHAVEMGCHTFDFGRSRRDNTGACGFKKNQGFEPTQLEYQTIAIGGRPPADLSPSNPRFSLARRLWPRLPGCIARPAGSWLSIHIPG
jgi:FemAB-related protein (PEP-CTERM system-associated)